MRALLRCTLQCAALALLTAAPAAVAFDEAAALRTSQQAIGREVRDLAFVIADGRRLRLYELRGKPVVISMIYTSCASICPGTTRRLAAAVRLAREALGPDGFTVLSVGFDVAHDTPAALREFAAAQRISDARWWFVSADADDIARLAEDTGFWFAPGAGAFDHLIQTTLVDGRGRVLRQVYGNEFRGLELADPLRKAALGAPLTAAPVRSLLDRVRLLCTVYDVRLGRYRVDYTLALSILIALTTLAGMVVFLLRSWRSGRPRGTA